LPFGPLAATVPIRPWDREQVQPNRWPPRSTLVNVLQVLIGAADFHDGPQNGIAATWKQGIADVVGWTRRTVQTALRCLETLGIIERVKVPGRRGYACRIRLQDLAPSPARDLERERAAERDSARAYAERMRRELVAAAASSPAPAQASPPSVRDAAATLEPSVIAVARPAFRAAFESAHKGAPWHEPRSVDHWRPPCESIARVQNHVGGTLEGAARALFSCWVAEPGFDGKLAENLHRLDWWGTYAQRLEARAIARIQVARVSRSPRAPEPTELERADARAAAREALEQLSSVLK
jgi:hypothetical protein